MFKGYTRAELLQLEVFASIGRKLTAEQRLAIDLSPSFFKIEEDSAGYNKDTQEAFEEDAYWEWYEDNYETSNS